MSTDFIKNAFKTRYNALIKQEQEIVQGYEDGILPQSYLHDYRLEIRFLESELQIKDKMKFRDIEDDEIVYLSDDDEYDYSDLPVLKTIEEKSLAELKSTKNLIISTKNLVNDKIKDIITEPINKDFSWGKYGDFNMVVCNQNGYMNGVFLIYEATEFEKKIRNNNKIPLKNITEWLSNKETIALLKTASIQEKINIDNLTFKRIGTQKRGESMLQGTYLHPILINSLATWVSPSYALKINDAVNEMIIEKKIKSEQDRMNDLLGIKNDIIAQMQRKYNEMDKRNEMLVINQEVVLRRLDNTVGRLNNAIGFVNAKKNDIRPTTDDDNIHHIYFYKFFDKQTHEFRTYTCYRTQPSNIQQRLDTAPKTLYPIKVFDEPSVNPIQIWIKFKKENKNNIDAHKCDFTLKGAYTENQLKTDMLSLLLEYDDVNF